MNIVVQQAPAVDVQPIFDMKLDTEEGIKTFAEKLQPYLNELGRIWGEIKALQDKFQKETEEKLPAAAVTGEQWMAKVLFTQGRLSVLSATIETGQMVLKDPAYILELAASKELSEADRDLLQRVSSLCQLFFS